MTNDLTTLSGALLEMKDELIYQLGQKGVTASYSSTDGLLGLIGRIADIQQGGGSCYHIEFSEDSYVAVGGTATLEILLQENYAPKSGATVTVTGSDSSSYTGTTNNEGIAQVTVSVSATTTFTATYGSVSDTCTVTVQSYLFYDACDSSAGLTNYGSSVLVRGSNASITMTYDSTENAYKMSGSGNYHAMIPIPSLNDEDGYTIKAEFKGPKTNLNAQGFFLDNRNDTTSYGEACFTHRYNNEFALRPYKVSQDGNVTNQTGLSLTGNVWYRIEMTVNGSSITGKLYDQNDTLKSTLTATQSVNNKQMGLFLFCEKGSTNSTCYVRNIKAEAL